MIDTDPNFARVPLSDSSPTERTFAVQNWKGDASLIMAVLDAEGRPLERVRYTAFGTPSAHPIADVDGNGVVEAADVTAFLTFQAGGANGTVFATTDLNADGFFPDDADVEFFDDEYVRVGAGSVFGMNRVSGVGSREGFGGAGWDSPTRGWTLADRVLESESDSWLSRRPPWEDMPPKWLEPAERKTGIPATIGNPGDPVDVPPQHDPGILESIFSSPASNPSHPCHAILVGTRGIRCTPSSSDSRYGCSVLWASRSSPLCRCRSVINGVECDSRFASIAVSRVHEQQSRNTSATKNNYSRSYRARGSSYNRSAQLQRRNMLLAACRRDYSN